MQHNDFKSILIKITKNWKFVVVVCILLSAVNLFLIQQNLLYKNVESLKNPILKTYKVVGNGFYLLKDSLKWLFLSGEEFIYPGTQIQSNEDSHVILTFSNQNGRVELAEKTLAGFYIQEGELFVEFKKGEMFISYQSTHTKRHIKVRVGDRVFKLQNTDLFITGDVTESVYVGVEYGRVNMQHNNLTNNFEKGQGVTLRPGRSYSVSESLFIFSNPLNYDRFSLDTSDKVSVRFAFAKFDKPLFFQLYSGNSPNVLKEHFSKPIAFSNNEIVAKFAKGSYYWQLAAFEKENSRPLFYSPIRRFFVEPKISIQPILPLTNTSIPLINGTANVKFQWDNPSQLERVYLEVSTDKNFSNLIVHENIHNNNYYNAEFTAAGTYYWRVSGFPFGTSDYLSGPSYSFKIQEGVGDNKIQIRFPKSNTIMTSVSLKNSDITFQWDKIESISKYRVVFVKKQNAETIQLETSDNFLKVTDLDAGAYEWFVQDADRAEVQSLRDSFTVLSTKKIDFKSRTERDRGMLLWEKGPAGTSSYRVDIMRIGTKSNFNEFFNSKSIYKKTSEIKKEQVSYKDLSEGIYAFKIYALDKRKKIIGDTPLRFVKVETL